MAIEDHPVLANHDHAQQIEQRIKSAASEYQSAIKKVAAERKALKHWQEDWIEAREEHVKRLNHLNSFIEHYVQKLDMIIPSSVWPSLIINDPKAPAYDDETADDYKQTIMDSHSYDEVAELIQDQEALKDLRQKREIAINIHKINSKNFPKRIARHKEQRKEAEKALEQTKVLLDEARALRPESVTKYLLTQGIGSLNPDRYPPVDRNELPPAYIEYFNIPLRQDQIASAANATDIVEAHQKNALEAEEKLQKAMLAQEKADARAAQSDREKELLEQKLAVALGAVQERADYTPEQLKQLQQRINLEIDPVRDYDKGRLKHVGRCKQFINERQPLGRKLEVLFKPDDPHAKREMCLRGGVYIEGTRFNVIVKEHSPNPEMPSGNIFLCVLDEEGYRGKEVRLALGPDRRQGWQVYTCLHTDLRWDDHFENSHPKVPKGAKSDRTYNYDQLLAFNQLLELKLLEM